MPARYVFNASREPDSSRLLVPAPETATPATGAAVRTPLETCNLMEDMLLSASATLQPVRINPFGSSSAIVRSIFVIVLTGGLPVTLLMPRSNVAADSEDVAVLPPMLLTRFNWPAIPTDPSQTRNSTALAAVEFWLFNSKYRRVFGLFVSSSALVALTPEI